MSRGRQSSIENRPDKGQIDAFLAAGVSLKQITAQIPDLSVHALSRYKRRHFLPPPTAESDSESLESQLATWTQRAELLYEASAVNADWRGQAQAIAAGLRGVQFALKNQGKLSVTEARDLPDSPAAWTEDEAEKFRGWMDHIIVEAGETSYASTEARMMALEIGLEREPKLLPLFQRIANDPVLLAQVQTLISGVTV